MAKLPPEFTAAPIAHRGLHGPGVPENSLAAALAAISAGYGIELDIQPAVDGTPMVFHDYDLVRLTGKAALINHHSVSDLAAMHLWDTSETVPTLAQMLELVGGRVPLLIEIKDQDGALGPDIGVLHKRVADTLQGYQGPVAVMSFNPHIVRAFHGVAPEIPVGITSCDFPAHDWPLVEISVRNHLAEIADFDDVGACFISHDVKDLTNPRVDALKAQGVTVLCWTVRSIEQESTARRIADNITFEGYRPDITV